jgi:S-adenosylmethionine/arginine decarboxylase-like enzyme
MMITRENIGKIQDEVVAELRSKLYGKPFEKDKVVETIKKIMKEKCADMGAKKIALDDSDIDLSCTSAGDVTLDMGRYWEKLASFVK